MPDTSDSITLKFRICEAQADAIRDFAAAEGITFSEMVRLAIFSFMKNHTVDARADLIQIRRDLAAIGNNLNQIARAANQSQQVDGLAEEIRALAFARQRLEQTLSQGRAGKP